ncbi:MAG: hypothetical protein A2Y41_11500 [Spirochaetes bacterium GWB1_36_13]|nr:MAG: hypothetical protein A2Y41_11500 [Spirochaetes bacterium GWB1_36_13]
MLTKIALSLFSGILVFFTSEGFFSYIAGGITLALIFLVFLSEKWIDLKYRYPVFAGFIGGGFGIFFASLLMKNGGILENYAFFKSSPFFIFILLTLFGFYFGFLGTLRISSSFSLFAAPEKEKKESGAQVKILDTSSIIDGRIIDVAATGFVEGMILIPKFVLNELQQVADSTDPVKRSRGRKGLNELSRLKQNKALVVKIFEKTYSEIREVDHKLIEMCKDQDGVLITTDYNLNKIASLEGIKVLNVNELANSLKPIVMTNEEISIVILKEGKDPNQGIGYLDDGTMVVVDGGRSFLGKEIVVTVTSVLQTSAGRMIFTHPKEK